MNHAELIVGSKELLETLSRTAASLIKSDGTTCIHLMHDIGHTEDDEYENNLEIAKSDAKLVQMPTTFNEPYFKERWNIHNSASRWSQNSNKQKHNCLIYWPQG